MPVNASPASPKSRTTEGTPPGRAETIAVKAPLRRQMLLFAAAAVVLLLDRVTKALVQHYLPIGAPQPVVGRLVYLTHTQNTGAAFSVGVSFGSFFLVLAAAISVAIVAYNRRLPAEEVLLRVGLGMIMGGALGNALDRAVAGSVTDFIDLRWWPVFNLADSCIVIGAVVSAARLAARDERRRS
jgi:signal peptidase II